MLAEGCDSIISSKYLISGLAKVRAEVLGCPPVKKRAYTSIADSFAIPCCSQGEGNRAFKRLEISDIEDPYLGSVTVISLEELVADFALPQLSTQVWPATVQPTYKRIAVDPLVAPWRANILEMIVDLAWISSTTPPNDNSYIHHCHLSCSSLEAWAAFLSFQNYHHQRVKSRRRAPQADRFRTFAVPLCSMPGAL